MAGKKVDAVAVKDASLFEISNDLKELLYIIEEADGEITEEVGKQLAIKQEQLAVKVEKYVYAIKAMNTYIDSCKKEKERISALQKRNEANVDRLKKALGEAALAFGDTTKSGSHYLQAGLNKVTCRRSSGGVIDTEFTSFVIEKCVEYMQSLFRNENTVFYRESQKNTVGLIEYVNNAIKERFPESDYYVDEDVLNGILVKGTFTGSITDIMYNKPLNAVVISGLANIADDNNITKAKKLIEEGKIVNYLYKNNDYVVTIS